MPHTPAEKIPPAHREAEQPGSRIRIDTDTDAVDLDGRRFQAAPVGPLVEELQAAGGLVSFAPAKAGG